VRRVVVALLGGLCLATPIAGNAGLSAMAVQDSTAPSPAQLVERGDRLRRGGHLSEAMAAYRRALAVDPANAEAAVGLARALAATGRYSEALQAYDALLSAHPNNYDALQGKAFVLYWTHRWAEARSIFEELQKKNPHDAENVVALERIARAEQEGVSSAARPGPRGAPTELLAHYQRLLQFNPQDTDAWKGLAATEAQLKNYAAAAADYRHVLAIRPGDVEAEVGLARVLAWNRQYEEAIRVYKDVLRQAPPGDAETLEGLARVYAWSNHPREAIQTYQTLASRDPTNPTYSVEVARLDIQIKDYRAARLALSSVLAVHPHDREARLELARLAIRQNRFGEALRQYEELLRTHPGDAEATLGKARMLYYRGEINPAHEVAARLVAAEPDNFDALFLLANIEHARGNRREALELLDRADRLSPNNPEVVAMREKLAQESRVTLRTTAAYVREIGRVGSGNPARLEGEDLRASTYGMTVRMALVPKSESSLSVSYLPSAIPRGGVAGAVGPAEILYQQSARLASILTLRGGAGAIRFGPGADVNFPSGAGPQPGSTVSPIGYAGGTLGPYKRLSLDLTWSRVPLAYTPLATRLGVLESRREAGVNYALTPRTSVRLTYYRVRDTTEAYAHLSNTINPASGQRVVTHTSDYVKGSGGTFLINRNVARSGGRSVDVGYSAMFYGFDGNRRNVFIGLFTPSFYQQHLLTAASEGRVRGPLGYDFWGGIGIQQVEQRQALTRALILKPALKLYAGRRVTFRLGYVYYDVAQAVGVVRGNGVELGTDWKF
jgi:tetratricopeptide (TPR) repeat protein